MLRTRICELLDIRHPVIQAGMANYAGPDLVAAVSNAGGLGILGAVDRDVDALERDIAAIRARTNRPFGVNLVLATPSDEKLALLLQQRVPVIATSWGDPTAVIAQVREHGLRSLHQVQTEVEAAHVAAAGVDALVAQGSDGGGHIGSIGTLALVPAVVDAAGDVPVMAAGGIADGRGLAAALALGAEGVFIGTRFLATDEATIAPAWKQALLAAGSADAWRSAVPDLLWGTAWPGASGRALANAFLTRWHGHETDLIAARATAQARVQAAEHAGDAGEFVAWSGQAVGLVHDILPAGALLERIVAEAEQALRRVQPQE